MREILKKINLFVANVLKSNNKEEVSVKIIITLTKGQAASISIMDRANYYLKVYEKDTFILPEDTLAKDIGKYPPPDLGTATPGSTT